MGKLNIPHDARVFISEGRKALFLRNAGDEKYLNLTTEQVFVDDNPPTHEQGSDRPDRAFQRASTNLRSGSRPPTGTSLRSTVSYSASQPRWKSSCTSAT